ncbi:MAG: hypothetical protein ACRDU8_06550 [Egibacteraceae bacterium]
MSLGVWAYPWDLAEEGVNAALDRLAGHGVEAVHVAAHYHSARVLSPRGRGKVRLVEAGLHAPLAADELISQRSAFARAHGTGFWDALAAGASERDLCLDAWTVLLHSSAVGGRLPGAVVENCFGDRYPWALCARQPDARAYATVLAGGLADRGWFRAVQLESVGYVGYRHFHHHEMEGVRTGPLEELLLSLCFCDACFEALAGRGFDATALRRRIAADLEARWRAERCSTDPVEVTDRLAEDAELAAAVAVRSEAVTQLLAAVRDRVGRAVEVHAMAAVFAPTLAQAAWLEGVDLSSWAPLIDRLLVLGYAITGPVSPDWVAAEVAAARAAVGGDAVGLGLNLTPGHTARLEDARERLRAAGELRHVSLYHEGMLADARLEWIPELSPRARS